jgi:phosphatidylinositol glycan class B
MMKTSNKATWWKGVHLIAIMGLAARLALAFFSDQIHWADEIFQTLEQAHRLVFGYGYVPWEFRFGARSWILPGFLSIWLLACKSLHLDQPHIYVPLVKAVMCVLSISLVYSAYVIGRNLASERAGRLAAILVAFWYELVYFAHKAMPEALATYLLVGALACAVLTAGQRTPMLFGLLAALAIAIRFHYLPALAVLVLFVCFVWRKNELLKAGVIFLFVISIAGFVDYLTWGQFLISYFNYYLSQSVYRLAERFGAPPVSYYLTTLMVASAGIFGVVWFICLTRLRRVWLPFTCALSIILAHSLTPHKEYRFVLVVIPLLLILAAIVLSDSISEYVDGSKQNPLTVMALLGFLVISSAGLLYKLPLQDRVYRQTVYAKDAILQAYAFLAQEPDVAAVLNAYTPWYWTGGYYYLHRDVPIYLPEHLESNLDSSDELTNYVSHIVCPAATEAIPGFQTSVRIGDLEIRKQTQPPAHYDKLDVDTREVPQPGMDDQFEPTVKRRF